MRYIPWACRAVIPAGSNYSTFHTLSIFHDHRDRSVAFFGRLDSAASLVGNNLLSRSLIPPSLSANRRVAKPPAIFRTLTSRMNRLLSTMKAVSPGLYFVAISIILRCQKHGWHVFASRHHLFYNSLCLQAFPQFTFFNLPMLIRENQQILSGKRCKMRCKRNPYAHRLFIPHPLLHRELFPQKHHHGLPHQAYPH